MNIFVIVFILTALITSYCISDGETIPGDPGERVGPGISGLFDHNGSLIHEVTKNHLQVGFRWQPYTDRPKSSESDVKREIGEIASYASFWYMSLHTLPNKKNLDYENYPSKEALAIRHAVKLCKNKGIKTELVLWQVPLWMNGGETYEDFNKIPPNDTAVYDMVKATVEWFGEDIDYYSIFHEANHPKYWDGTWEELIDLFMFSCKLVCS